MKTKQDIQKRIRQERSAVLVVNTHSRRGEQLFFAAMDELAKRGVHVAASYPVRDPARLSEAVREGIERGHALVIVGGGDGTISSIVDYFAYRDVVLGILPLGTGNSFARTLGIPLSLNGALDVIVNGKVVDIDLGKVNDDYFANVASLGFSADIARQTPRSLKRYLGVVAYVLVGVWNLLERQAFRCRLELDGETHVLRTHQIIIANGSFFGVTKLAPDAQVNNRQFIVFTMDTVSRWQMAKLWVAFWLGRHRAFSEARYFATREVTIDAVPPQYIDVDGETTTRTPVRITLAAEALKVLAPVTFEDE
ncbi:MAG: YegS/Rv2252/BmrU family lipid kinase [Chloroflexota bacterium]|nr:MAG: YegS/Rv2252/BmrU family lipid kinase [Chloroflexota bacterium]